LSGSFGRVTGRATGGLWKLPYKSGTNQLHGTEYEIVRKRVGRQNSWIKNYKERAVANQDNQHDLV